MGIPFLDDLFTPQLSGRQKTLMQQATTPAVAKVAKFDPLQTQGQEMVLGTTGQQGDIAQQGFGANEFLLNDVLFPGTNPALQQTIDFATQPIMEKFTQDILPAIRGGAESTNQFGGSRRANMEARAASDVERNIGGVSSVLANEGYLSGLKGMMFGAGLVPQTQQNLETPGLTTSGVGDVRQQQVQNKYNADTANQAAQAASAAQQFGMLPQTPSTAQQLIGLASAVAPFFAASDRRLKKDIEKIGELFDGTSVYRFRYKFGGPLLIGLMADEVTSEAIREHEGFKYVNYEVATEAAAQLGSRR